MSVEKSPENDSSSSPANPKEQEQQQQDISPKMRSILEEEEYKSTILSLIDASNEIGINMTFQEAKEIYRILLRVSGKSRLQRHLPGLEEDH